MEHISVLKEEAIKYLNPKPNENFVDCTVNGGGHSMRILELNGSKGKLLGIDWDQEAIKKARIKTEKFKNRVILENDNFLNLKEIVKKNKFNNISGILLDLGFSSFHTDESERGFTFQKNEPLDMRYCLENPMTAEKAVNYKSEADLERIFREYGQEKFSKQIAKAIIDARVIIEIKTTGQLVEIIKRVVPGWYLRGKIHFATKTFQALRIEVNDELNNIEKVLPQALEVLEPGGRLVAISFHSLEDKIIKNFYKSQAKEGLLDITTKKPIGPGKEEITINPRSRSAKLRAAIKK
jgi:16S rRNA (cytosine1402-N4)-methyltransferase